jgi:hypothetical protein
MPSPALFCHTGRQRHLFRATTGGTGIDVVVRMIEKGALFPSRHGREPDLYVRPGVRLDERTGKKLDE